MILIILGSIVSTDNWPPCPLQNHNYPLSLLFVVGPNRCSHCPNCCSHWYCSPASWEDWPLITERQAPDEMHITEEIFLVITEHKHPTRCIEEAFSWSWKEKRVPLLVFFCGFMFLLFYLYICIINNCFIIIYIYCFMF